MDMIQDVEVMENATRRRLYRYISKFPGVSFPDLREILDMNDGTLRYHLHYLVRMGLVKEFERKGSKVYYRTLRSPDLDEVRSRVQPGTHLTERQESLVIAIKRHDGWTQKDLCRDLRMNRFTFNYNVKALMGHGLVMVNRSGRNARYHYLKNGELERYVLQRAAIDLLQGRIDERTFLSMKKALEDKGR